jgi:VanZ family protein
MSVASFPRRRLIRWLFFAFAGSLFVATHWPNLRVPGPVYRGDLWIHAAVYAVWTSLLLACTFFDSAIFSRRNIARTVVVAILYAGLDELTQALPGLQRVAAWDDFGADCVGVAIVGVCALVASQRRLSLKEKPHHRDTEAQRR